MFLSVFILIVHHHSSSVWWTSWHACVFFLHVYELFRWLWPCCRYCCSSAYTFISILPKVQKWQNLFVSVIWFMRLFYFAYVRYLWEFFSPKFYTNFFQSKYLSGLCFSLKRSVSVVIFFLSLILYSFIFHNE